MFIEQLSFEERSLLLVENREDLTFLHTIKYSNDGNVEPVGTELHAHLLRVGRNARFIGQVIWGADSVQQELLFVGGILHDIGKIDLGINEPKLLSNRRRFDKKDRSRMERHTTLGYHTLKIQNNSTSKFAAIAAALHHDFKPGSDGFDKMPFGVESTIEDVRKNLEISKSEIMQMVLTISVCDVFDAITNREYVSVDLLPASFNATAMTSWVRSFVSVEAATDFGVDESDLSKITSNLAWMLAEPV